MKTYLIKSGYLLDECILRTDERRESCSLPQAIDYLPMGTKDDTVLAEAVKHGLIVVTKDMKFVVRTVRQGIPIIYVHRGQWHLIGQILIDNQLDQVGIYCKNNNSVILP